MKNKINVSSSDNRELQEQQALSTSSSRLSLELTYSNLFRFAIKLLCISLLLLISLNLISQETTQANDYYFIKKLIETKEISKAKQELQKALMNNPHDPTLNLYQAEIWILEADYAYTNGNTTHALQLYEEAVKVYPANPLVQMRLKELKSSRRVVPISLVPNALIPQGNSIPISREAQARELGYVADNNKQLLYTILVVQIMILFFLAGLYRK